MVAPHTEEHMDDKPPFPLHTPLPFYGVDNNRFKLGAVVYEAREDDRDGYRSYLDSVVVSDGGIFFGMPVDTVEAVELLERDFEGFALKSAVDGKEWLRFGTESDDPYYPQFVFRYSART